MGAAILDTEITFIHLSFDFELCKTMYSTDQCYFQVVSTNLIDGIFLNLFLTKLK